MKRSISILLTAFLGVSLILGGCGGSGQGAAVKDTSASAAQTETPAPDSQETTSGAESEETGPSPADESGSPADSAKELTAGESGDEPHRFLKRPYLHGTGVPDGQGGQGRNLQCI